MDGFLCLDKPSGPTSMDAVRHVRRALKVKRMGHSGTLDPQASGLLVLAVGKATRLLNYLPLEPKEYSFEIVFGAQTDTMDEAGQVVDTSERIPTGNEVEEILPRFTGQITQTPPRFSAVKIKGVRAYKLARKNQEFEIAQRTVTIEKLDLENFDAQRSVALLKVRCSGGTYVRSLAGDIAEKLGAVGHAAKIRRLAMGEFLVENAIGMDNIKDLSPESLTSMESAFLSQPSIRVPQSMVTHIVQGRDIDSSDNVGDAQTVFVFSETNHLLAIAEKIAPNRFHPSKVFAQA